MAKAPGNPVDQHAHPRAELGVAEARFEILFESSPDIVAVLAVDGTVLDMNRVAPGYDKQDVLGTGFADYLDPEQTRLFEDTVREAIRTGRPQGYEVAIPNPEGRIFHWYNRVSPVIIDSRVEQLVINCTDVTEHRRAQAALHAEKRFIDTALDAQLDTFFLFDPATGKALRWNRAFTETSGYTDEEVARLPAPATYYCDADLARAGPFVEQVLQTGTGTIELELVCKDGRTVPTEYQVAVIPDEQGEPRYLVSIGRDITRRKQSEQALQFEKLRTQQYLDVAGVMLLALDAEGRVALINPKGCEILGYPEEEILGKSWFQTFIDPEDSDRIAQVFEQILAGQVEVTDYYENAVVRRDGTKRMVAWHNSILRDGTGKPIGTFSSGEDITDRRRAEEERAKVLAQLHQSQKMESVGQLAGGIAHDFNNLLTVINSYSSMAMEDLPESHPLYAQLEQILSAGERAASLTRQLLAFSRKQVLNPRVIDLNQVVRHLEAMLRRLIGEDIEFMTRFADELGDVHADPGQIEQVLLNLVLNARDAMPTGGRLTIETADVFIDEAYANSHPDTRPGPYVMLAVSDDGVGMDAETCEHAFEPFFTTKPTGQGTGLGLSTAYGIVKQSGGVIWAYSEPGHGTTVKVYLPRIEGRVRATAAKAIDQGGAGTETILVVEDEEAVRELTALILTSAGYRVITATDGPEALLEHGRHPDRIDLLLTDVVMPGMSGKELADRLTGLTPHLGVLYMSGYTDNAIVHHGVLDEGTHFIAKPFRGKGLLAKVRSVLDSGPPGGER